MRGDPSISPIYRQAEPDAPDPERAFARTWRFARELYQKSGIIVVWPGQLPEEDSKALTNWANNEYGRRPNGRG